ncbi:hypothetical protein [Actinoplanes sp. RD1]|uniref:hypothetical protein n=1 Tax=Actinoplanes sp. RD1 TaxID=3064538 RepID=UPI002741A03A|nr:hypothetical protein [Actinoplanes sp. RD1]
MISENYHVVVTKEGTNWLADVPQLEGAHTYARSLKGLDREVREVIALVEDLPEGAEDDLSLSFEFHTGDATLDEATARIRADRARLATEERSLAEHTLALATEMRKARMPVRDVAELLGISSQRVSQIAPERDRRAG